MFISNQPFCLYQHAVAIAKVPQGFEIETVGSGTSEEYKQRPSLLLDTVARRLYQAQQMKLTK